METLKTFLIIILVIFLAVSLAVLSREKRITKSLRAKIRFLETEKAAVKKRNGQLFMAEVKYIRVFRSHKIKITSISKKKDAELKDHLINYEKNSQYWEDLYLYNKV